MSSKPIEWISCLILCLVGLSTQAQKVDFENEVWPILKTNCIECHGAENHEGSLRLDARAIAFQGGVSGPGITADKLQQSMVYQRLILQDEGDNLNLKLREVDLPARAAVHRVKVSEAQLDP